MRELNENEQWEAIKAWWKENGRVVIVTVIVMAALTIGYRHWQSTKQQESQTASILYDQLISNVFSAQHSDEALAKFSYDLEQNYTKTPYAADAALFEAEDAVEKNNLKLAQEKLNWVIEHAKDSNMRQIAKIRLARLLLAQKQLDEALKMLSSVEGDSYVPAIDVVKGDIYLAKNDRKMAKQFYQEAFNVMPDTQSIRQYLRMQLDQLGDV